uniref:VWFD domain-containing protein n=1 Tax=Macrostomum lignano TaxID=282301 RepID=A0A1I8JET4_9PLAT
GDNGSAISLRFAPGQRLDRFTVFASGNDRQAARLDAVLDKRRSRLTAALDTGLGGFDFPADLRASRRFGGGSGGPGFRPNATLVFASAGVSDDGRRAHAAVLVGRMRFGQWPDPAEPASVPAGLNLFSLGLRLHGNNSVEGSSAWRSERVDGVKSAVAHLKESLLDTWMASGLRAFGSASDALLRAAGERLLKSVDAKQLAEEATNPLLADLTALKLYAEAVVEAVGSDPRLGAIVRLLKRFSGAASWRVAELSDWLASRLSEGGVGLVDLRLAERVQLAADAAVEFVDSLPLLAAWRAGLDAGKSAAGLVSDWLSSCLEVSDSFLRRMLSSGAAVSGRDGATASVLRLLSERASQLLSLGSAKAEMAKALLQIELALQAAVSDSLGLLADDLLPFAIGHLGDLVRLKEWLDDALYELRLWIDFGAGSGAAQRQERLLSWPLWLARQLAGPGSLGYWRNLEDSWRLLTNGEFAAAVRRLLMTDAYGLRVWRPVCDAKCRESGDAAFAAVVGDVYPPVYLDSLSPRVWRRRLARVRSIRATARRFRDRLFATSSDGYVLLSTFNDWRQMDAGLWDPLVRQLAMRHRTAVLAGGRSLITFDGISLVNPLPCSYVLAHDFRLNEFTVAQSYREVNGTAVRHDLLVRFGSVQYSISPSGVLKINGRIEKLPMSRYVGGRLVQAERKKSRLLVRFHGETLRNTLLLRCNSITDSCLLRVHPLYQARVNGMAGSNDGHRANDLQGGSRDSHIRYWTSGRCLATETGGPDATLSPAVESPEAEANCRLWFSRGNFSFDKCFITVNPRPYLDLCRAFARLGKDICEVAVQYTDRCRNELVNINTPYSCVRCRVDEETTIVKDDLISEPRVLRKRLQAVFLLENSDCVASAIGLRGSYISYLAKLIERLNMSYPDLKSVEFGLAHFGGQGEPVLTAHPIHDTSRRFGNLADLNAGLVKVRLNGTSVHQFDVLKALAALQTQYAWEPLAQKHIFLFSCQTCTARSWDYARAFDKAFKVVSSEIFLHVITKRGIPRPTRINDWLQNLIGYDRREVFYSDRRAEPIGSLTALNPSASGTVWHLDRFAASRSHSVKISRRIFAWLQTRLERPLCQRCSCALSDSLVGQPRCQADNCHIINKETIVESDSCDSLRPEIGGVSPSSDKEEQRLLKSSKVRHTWQPNMVGSLCAAASCSAMAASPISQSRHSGQRLPSKDRSAGFRCTNTCDAPHISTCGRLCSRLPAPATAPEASAAAASRTCRCSRAGDTSAKQNGHRVLCGPAAAASAAAVASASDQADSTRTSSSLKESHRRRWLARNSAETNDSWQRSHWCRSDISASSSLTVEASRSQDMTADGCCCCCSRIVVGGGGGGGAAWTCRAAGLAAGSALPLLLRIRQCPAMPLGWPEATRRKWHRRRRRALTTAAVGVEEQRLNFRPGQQPVHLGDVRVSVLPAVEASPTAHADVIGAVHAADVPEQGGAAGQHLAAVAALAVGCTRGLGGWLLLLLGRLQHLRQRLQAGYFHQQLALLARLLCGQIGHNLPGRLLFGVADAAEPADALVEFVAELEFSEIRSASLPAPSASSDCSASSRRFPNWRQRFRAKRRILAHLTGWTRHMWLRNPLPECSCRPHSRHCRSSGTGTARGPTDLAGPAAAPGDKRLPTLPSPPPSSFPPPPTRFGRVGGAGLDAVGQQLVALSAAPLREPLAAPAAGEFPGPVPVHQYQYRCVDAARLLQNVAPVQLRVDLLVAINRQVVQMVGQIDPEAGPEVGLRRHTLLSMLNEMPATLESGTGLMGTGHTVGPLYLLTEGDAVRRVANHVLPDAAVGGHLANGDIVAQLIKHGQGARRLWEVNIESLHQAGPVDKGAAALMPGGAGVDGEAGQAGAAVEDHPVGPAGSQRPAPGGVVQPGEIGANAGEFVCSAALAIQRLNMIMSGDSSWQAPAETQVSRARAMARQVSPFSLVNTGTESLLASTRDQNFSIVEAEMAALGYWPRSTSRAAVVAAEGPALNLSSAGCLQAVAEVQAARVVGVRARIAGIAARDFVIKDLVAGVGRTPANEFQVGTAEINGRAGPVDAVGHRHYAVFSHQVDGRPGQTGHVAAGVPLDGALLDSLGHVVNSGLRRALDFDALQRHILRTVKEHLQHPGMRQVKYGAPASMWAMYNFTGTGYTLHSWSLSKTPTRLIEAFYIDFPKPPGALAVLNKLGHDIAVGQVAANGSVWQHMVGHSPYSVAFRQQLSAWHRGWPTRLSERAQLHRWQSGRSSRVCSHAKIRRLIFTLWDRLAANLSRCHTVPLAAGGQTAAPIPLAFVMRVHRQFGAAVAAGVQRRQASDWLGPPVRVENLPPVVANQILQPIIDASRPWDASLGENVQKDFAANYFECFVECSGVVPGSGSAPARLENTILGEATVIVTNYQERQYQLTALVVKGDRVNLLGRDWLSSLKIDWSKFAHADGAGHAVRVLQQEDGLQALAQHPRLADQVVLDDGRLLVDPAPDAAVGRVDVHQLVPAAVGVLHGHLADVLAETGEGAAQVQVGPRVDCAEALVEREAAPREPQLAVRLGFRRLHRRREGGVGSAGLGGEAPAGGPVADVRVPATALKVVGPVAVVAAGHAVDAGLVERVHPQQAGVGDGVAPQQQGVAQRLAVEADEQAALLALRLHQPAADVATHRQLLDAAVVPHRRPVHFAVALGHGELIQPEVVRQDVAAWQRVHQADPVEGDEAAAACQHRRPVPHRQLARQRVPQAGVHLAPVVEHRQQHTQRGGEGRPFRFSEQSVSESTRRCSNRSNSGQAAAPNPRAQAVQVHRRVHVANHRGEGGVSAFSAFGVADRPPYAQPVGVSHQQAADCGGELAVPPAVFEVAPVAQRPRPSQLPRQPQRPAEEPLLPLGRARPGAEVDPQPKLVQRVVQPLLQADQVAQVANGEWQQGQLDLQQRLRHLRIDGAQRQQLARPLGQQAQHRGGRAVSAGHSGAGAQHPAKETVRDFQAAGQPVADEAGRGFAGVQAGTPGGEQRQAVDELDRGVGGQLDPLGQAQIDEADAALGQAAGEPVRQLSDSPGGGAAESLQQSDDGAEPRIAADRLDDGLGVELQRSQVGQQRVGRFLGQPLGVHRLQQALAGRPQQGVGRRAECAQAGRHPGVQQRLLEVGDGRLLAERGGFELTTPSTRSDLQALLPSTELLPCSRSPSENRFRPAGTEAGSAGSGHCPNCIRPTSTAASPAIVRDAGRGKDQRGIWPKAGAAAAAAESATRSKVGGEVEAAQSGVQGGGQAAPPLVQDGVQTGGLAVVAGGEDGEAVQPLAGSEPQADGGPVIALGAGEAIFRLTRFLLSTDTPKSELSHRPVDKLKRLVDAMRRHFDPHVAQEQAKTATARFVVQRVDVHLDRRAQPRAGTVARRRAAGLQQQVDSTQLPLEADLGSCRLPVAGQLSEHQCGADDTLPSQLQRHPVEQKRRLACRRRGPDGALAAGHQVEADLSVGRSSGVPGHADAETAGRLRPALKRPNFDSNQSGRQLELQRSLLRLRSSLKSHHQAAVESPVDEEFQTLPVQGRIELFGNHEVTLWALSFEAEVATTGLASPAHLTSLPPRDLEPSGRDRSKPTSQSVKPAARALPRLGRLGQPPDPPSRPAVTALFSIPSTNTRLLNAMQSSVGSELSFHTEVDTMVRLLCDCQIAVEHLSSRPAVAQHHLPPVLNQLVLSRQLHRSAQSEKRHRQVQGHRFCSDASLIRSGRSEARKGQRQVGHVAGSELEQLLRQYEMKHAVQTGPNLRDPLAAFQVGAQLPQSVAPRPRQTASVLRGQPERSGRQRHGDSWQDLSAGASTVDPVTDCEVHSVATDCVRNGQSVGRVLPAVGDHRLAWPPHNLCHGDRIVNSDLQSHGFVTCGAGVATRRPENSVEHGRSGLHNQLDAASGLIRVIELVIGQVPHRGSAGRDGRSGQIDGPASLRFDCNDEIGGFGHPSDTCDLARLRVPEDSSCVDRRRVLTRLKVQLLFNAEQIVDSDRAGRN